MTTRPLAGRLVALLGYLGVLLSVIGLVLVWYASSRTTRAIDQTAEALLEFTGAIADEANEAGTKLSTMQQLLQDQQEQLDSTLESGGLQPDQWRRVLAKIDVGTEEVQNWMTVARSTQDFANVLGQILASAESLMAAEGKAEVSTALTQGALKIQSTEASLAILQEQLTIAREGVSDEELTQRAKPFLTRCGETLEELASGVAVFSESVEQAGDGVDELRRRLNSRIFWTAIVLSLLLVWHGFAQWCLAERGRRMMNSAIAQG